MGMFILLRIENMQRPLKWLERSLLIAGLTLLLAFFSVRGWSEMQRQNGVDDFLAATGGAAPLQTKLDGLDVSVAEPNTELWSAKRIADYRNNLKVDAGPPLALLTIEKLQIEVPVFNGADEFNLNRGVARIEGTARIDQVGNLGIAGHRDGFFRQLKDMAVGDDISLRTPAGLISYRVSRIDIVDPSDISVLRPTAVSTLTLVTCYPFYFVGHAPKRFVVRAEAEHFLATT